MSKVREQRTELDPADYEFCCEYYCGPNEDIADAYSREAWPEDCPLLTLGNCDHCGTAHFYGAIFRAKDGSYLTIGNVCATKFFNFASRKAYLTMQADLAKRTRELSEKRRKEAEAFLAAHPELVEAFKVDHHIIQSIHAALIKYGNLSDRQVNLVLKIADEKPEEEVKAKPIPEELLDGRHEFTGKVLGFKDQDGYYGTTTKMVFRDDRGFTIYGTAFSADQGYEKGDRLTFHAAIEQSKNDNTFGFFKRPTRGKVIDVEDNNTD